MAKIKTKKADIPQTPDGKKNTMKTVIDEYDVKDLIAYYKTEYDIAVDARYKFINNQLKWYKRRHGIRGEVTYPWPGASNQHLPLPDKTIRKYKPHYVQAVEGPSPMVSMDNFGGEDEAMEADQAVKASWHFDWLLRTRMNVFEDIVLCADTTLSKGFAIARTPYEVEFEPIYSTITRESIEQKEPRLLEIENIDDLLEMLSEITTFKLDNEKDAKKLNAMANSLIAGEEVIEYVRMEITYDAPRIYIHAPEEIVVPKETESVFLLEKARWICRPYYVTAEDLIRDSEGDDAKWDREVVLDILGADGIDITKETLWLKYRDKMNYVNNTEKEDLALQADLREGIFGGDVKGYLMYEFCIWFDSDNDNIPERHILEFCQSNMDKPMRFVHYTLPLNRWHYVKVPYEICEKRHYSPRGQIEILDPISKALNVKHNQENNARTIETSLNYWYVPDQVNEENIDFVFNRGIPVKDGNSIGMLQTQNGAADRYTQPKAELKAWADELIGAPEVTEASAINPVPGQGRTKFELQMMSMQKQPVKMLDLKIFLYAWKFIYENVWALWMTYGPLEELSFKMNDELVKLKRDELIGKYNIAPNARIGSDDPETQAMKAFKRLEYYKGDIYYDQYELKRDALMKDDPRLVKRLLRPKEVVGELIQAQQQIQQLQSQVQQMGSVMKGRASQDMRDEMKGKGVEAKTDKKILNNAGGNQ